MNDPLFIKAHELGLLMVVSNARTTPVASVAASKVVNTSKAEDVCEDNPGGSGEADELANMSVEELLEKAEELGIDVQDGIGKKKLKKLIREAMEFVNTKEAPQWILFRCLVIIAQHIFRRYLPLLGPPMYLQKTILRLQLMISTKHFLSFEILTME